MHPHPHPADPNNDSQAQYKLCNSCCAKRPLEAFTLNKYGSHGRASECIECRSQAQRMYRRIKYQAISKIDDSLIRNVSHQNETIVELVLALPTFQLECCAFDYTNLSDYKVFFGKSDRIGMQAVTIFNLDGSLFHEYAYSGSKTPGKAILSLVKALNLRLELTQIDMINSKQTIYYV